MNLEKNKIRIQTFIRYTELLKQLVVRDLKLRYRRSFLGYLWSILNPLMIMFVQVIVFSGLFNRGDAIQNFPVYLICGRIIYEFNTSATTSAMRSIYGNAPLIKKIYVPKYIFTLAKVTSALIDSFFSMGALLVVMIVTRAEFTPYLLLIPIVLIQMYIFCCGLGFFLAQGVVFFRDIQHIYSAFTTAWMYLTPIFYSVDDLPANIQFVIKGFNPLYYYLAQFRDLVCNAQLPGPRIFWGGWLIAIVSFAIGVLTFKKNQDKFILYI